MLALVVDDSNTARLMMAFVLRDLGYEVKEAADGQAALDALRQGPQPDLMTLDWNMPGVSGGQVLDVLAAEPQLRPGKVMVVTSEVELRMVHRVLGMGGDEYLMKPYTAEALREKLELLGQVQPSGDAQGRG
jgi:two-component system chemotaxis response regulator CheY